jgi:hypothetical protein
MLIIGCDFHTRYVAGYTASSSAASLDTNVTTNQQSTTFYWVFGATAEVMFAVTYKDSSNVQRATSGQATFNVAGASGSLTIAPTSNTMTIQDWSQMPNCVPIAGPIWCSVF